MDREVVEQKLESLRRCINRIETKCPVDAATLVADIDLQDVVSLNLSRAVQISVDIGRYRCASDCGNGSAAARHDGANI